MLATSATAFSQLNLEHISDTPLTRIIIPPHGEKYYNHDVNQDKYHFFHADYSFWMSMDLHTPDDLFWWSAPYISANVINDDPAIEVAYVVVQDPIWPGAPTAGMVVNSENEVLFSVENPRRFGILRKPGLDPKLYFSVPGTAYVYDLPSFTQEFELPPHYDFNHADLEVSGPKYYCHYYQTGLITVFNADFSIWKTISTELHPTDRIVVFSEHEVNGDDLLEIGIHSSSTNTFRVINENGDELLEIENVINGVSVDRTGGLEPKIRIDIHPQTNQYGTLYYNLNGLTIAQYFENSLTQRIKLANSGEKFHPQQVDGTQLMLYNPDQSVFKEIDLPVPQNAEKVTVIHISESEINPDAQVEIVYGLDDNDDYVELLEVRVINESGAIYNVFQGPFASFEESRPGEASLKFIAHLMAGDQYLDTRVYSAGQLATAPIVKQPLKIFPNPAFDKIFISSEVAVKRVELLNMSSQLLTYTESDQVRSLDISAYAPGVYFVRATNVNGESSVHKIVISR